jgi:hypothetical protein
VIAQDDLDSDARQIQAERAPGFSGNSEDSVARPDGDPGFKLAAGYLMLPESFPLVRRLASYASRRGDGN